MRVLGTLTMGVTEYLENARECAALADATTGEEKKRLLAIAESWLKLAEQAAANASKQGPASPNGGLK